MENKCTPEPWSNAGIKAERDKLRALNSDLVAALQAVVKEADLADDWQPWAEQCRKAIAKATQP